MLKKRTNVKSRKEWEIETMSVIRDFLKGGEANWDWYIRIHYIENDPSFSSSNRFNMTEERKPNYRVFELIIQ